MPIPDGGSEGPNAERLSQYNLSPEDIELQDLVVEAGKTVSTAEQTRVTVKPKSVSELNDMIGTKPGNTHPPVDEDMPSSIPSTEDLRDSIGVENPPPGSADEDLQGAVSSILNNDTSASNTLSIWKDRLDNIAREDYLNLEFDLFPASSITIQDGGRFHVDKSTPVVYATTVTIIGSGELTFEGRTTIDSVSIEGKR